MPRNIETALAQYRKLNDSFSENLVFHLGASAGFFSEYNNMILAMLYCLAHRIRFVLYSADANFGFDRGWRDYFLPFAPETMLAFHSRRNYRTPLERRNDPAPDTLRLRAVRRLTRTHFFTFELFEQIRAEAKSGRSYSIPELGIDGDVHHACRTLVGLTWRFNDATARFVEGAAAASGLPQEYLGFHIRGGDKAREAAIRDADAYVRRASELSNLTTAFVLTDDFSNVETLRRSFPQWDFLTSASPGDSGYYQGEFKALPASLKKKAILRLLADATILSRSRLFVGTFSSNPGMFLGMTMEPERCTGLDARRWYVW